MFLTVKELIIKIGWQKTPYSLFKLSIKKNLEEELIERKIEYQKNDYDKVIKFNLYCPRLKKTIINNIESLIEETKKKINKKQPDKINEFYKELKSGYELSLRNFRELVEKELWTEVSELFNQSQLYKLGTLVNTKTTSKVKIIPQIKNINYKIEEKKVFLDTKDELTKQFIELTTTKNATFLKKSIFINNEETEKEILEKTKELLSNAKFKVKLQTLLGEF